MTTLREAAQQALEALEEFGTHYEHCPRYPTWARPEMQPPCNCGLDSNVAALRDALAQQPQTPCDIAEDGVCEVIDCCRNSTQEEPATRAQRMRDAGYTRRPTLREMTEQEKGPK